MESGPIVGGEVGIALSPRIAAGVRFDIGVGYGAYVGLRYRASQRLGGALDFGIEHSPGTSSGSYYPARMALAVYF